MYAIKQIPEDFMVWEIPDHKLDEEGYYAYFWLRKKNYTTLRAVKEMAIKLHIPLKNIGFAGNKDKAAVTEQVVSIRAIDKKRIEKLNLRDIELTYIGQGADPISIGDLKGNRFRITVRNIPSRRLLLKTPKKIPNLFGQQRFSKNNAEIGKAIVQKNFRKAVDLIDNKEVKDYIENNPGDPVGAIRALSLKLRKLYVHAYQSLIWNETVKEYLETSPFKNELIPIVGFGTDLKRDKMMNIIRKILNKERITQRDFIIPQMPELSSEGTERDLFVEPENFQISTAEDELNETKSKAIVQFTLPKASYATTVIEHMFKQL